jgi:hypothetical protein
VSPDKGGGGVVPERAVIMLAVVWAGLKILAVVTGETAFRRLADQIILPIAVVFVVLWYFGYIEG